MVRSTRSPANRRRASQEGSLELLATNNRYTKGRKVKRNIREMFLSLVMTRTNSSSVEIQSVCTNESRRRSRTLNRRSARRSDWVVNPLRSNPVTESSE